MKWLGQHKRTGKIKSTGSITTGGPIKLQENLSGSLTGTKTITSTGALELDTTGVGGNITLDASNDIYLNADGGDVVFQDDAVNLATLTSASLTVGPDDDSTFSMVRTGHTDEDGGNFLLTAGRGTGTNKEGGDIQIGSGISTGTGVSSIIFRVPSAGSSGSSSNAAAEIANFTANGLKISVAQKGIIFEGGARDTTLRAQTTSASDHTITLPDASGTVALTSDLTAYSRGWHGSTSRIKILHSDFIADDGGRPMMIDDSGVGSEELFLETFSTFPAYATVTIPTGYTATHVMVYGTGTPAIEVWEHEIDSKTGVSKGTGNVDTEIDITDVESSTTNYLFIQVAQGGSDEIHGGYVTITAT